MIGFFLVENSIVSEQVMVYYAYRNEHGPPFWTRLQLNPNSVREIRRNGKKSDTSNF